MTGIKNIINFFDSISIKTKLLLLMGSFAGLIIFLPTFYLINELETRTLKELSKKTHLTADILSYSISPAVYLNDSESISEVGSGLFTKNYLRTLDVYNNSSELITSLNNVKMLALEKKLNQKPLIQGEDYLIEKRILYFQGIKCGQLKITVSISEVRAEIKQKRDVLAILGIFVFATLLIIISIISNYFIRPIKNIEKTFSNIASGNLSIRAAEGHGDEIGKMAASFNSMVDKLEIAYCDLAEENEERKKIQNELIKAKEEVIKALEIEKQLSELKTRFVTRVSHEYRTPLTIILSSTYILQRYFELGDKVNFQNQLLMIQSSVSSMTELLDKTLLISTSDNWQIQFQPKLINLIEVCSSIIAEAKKMDKFGHNIIFKHNVQKLAVETDLVLIRQILSNILSNAVKFSGGRGNIEVEIYTDNKEIKLEVRDQGVGIPQSELHNITEPFFRASNTGNSSGIGLGLSIASKCVEVLNGHLIIESVLNEGTVVSVILPRKQVFSEKLN